MWLKVDVMLLSRTFAVVDPMESNSVCHDTSTPVVIRAPQLHTLAVHVYRPARHELFLFVALRAGQPQSLWYNFNLNTPRASAQCRAMAGEYPCY